MINLPGKSFGVAISIFAIILITLLVVVKSDIDEQSAYLCQMTHENPDLDITECPAHNSNTTWYIMIAFGIAFMVLAGGLYLTIIGGKAKENQAPTKENIVKDNTNQFKEIDLSRLNDEEKKVYLILKRNDGSMYQSDLIKETEFSKVQMTRILDRLEHKKILDRKRRGMTNIVVLQ